MDNVLMDNTSVQPPTTPINPIVNTDPQSPISLPHRPKFIIILVGIIIILTAITVVVAKNRSSSLLLKPTPTIPIPSPKPDISPTNTPIPASTIKPTLKPTSTARPTPTTTPTAASTTGQLKVIFQPLYTQETIKDYEVTISKSHNTPPLISVTGHGQTYSNDKLPAGHYIISARTGINNQYCGTSGDSTIAAVEFNVVAGQTTNLTLNIFPYPSVVFLKTKNYFPIANAQVSTGFYSAITDQLGRAVLYNINPGPYNLGITVGGQKFNQPVADNNCLWLQQIISPLDTVSSTVSVTINPTVEYLSLQPQLIIKDVSLDIKPNSLGNRLPADDARRHYLTLSHCRGLEGTYFGFGSAVSLYQSGTPQGPQINNTVQIQNVDNGNYQVCVFNSANPDASYASTVTNISVNGLPVATTIDYPKTY